MIFGGEEDRTNVDKRDEREKTKLHILQVHNYYKIPGGEDRVVENERAMLTKHGHKVWFYGRKNEELSSMKPWKKLCLPFTTVFSLKTYRDVKRIIKEKKIDVVHVHNTLPLVSPSVFYAAFTSGVPAVMSVHNFRLLCPGALFYRNGKACEECLKQGLHRSIKYGCYRKSRLQTLLCVISMKLHRAAGTYKRIFYICLTEFNKEKLLQLNGVRPERVFVKPNFAGKMEEDNPLEEREDFFLYGGRLEEDKGVKVLLEAFRKLEDRHLTVCGEGVLQSWCENYIKRYSIKNVTLKGAVSGEVLKGLMGRAKAVIVPSLLYEGFPMIMAEAYGTHTPVIGSDGGNVGRLLEETGGWQFETGNADSLAEAVKRCCRGQKDFEGNEEKRDLEEWSEEGNYKKLLKIYGRCIRDVRKAKEK